MPAHSCIQGLSHATKADLSHYFPFPGPGSIGIVLIVISGVDDGGEGVVVLVGDVVVGVVFDVVAGVVGVVVVGVAGVVTGATVTVWGAGCWGRGPPTGISRGGGVTTTVDVSATGAITGCEVAGATGAEDTAMLLAELAGAVSPSNWVMPKNASAAIDAAADVPKATRGPRLRGATSSQSCSPNSTAGRLNSTGAGGATTSVTSPESSDQASAAGAMAAATVGGAAATAGAVGVSVVAVSSDCEPVARSDAPAAAVSWGCGVVTTWVRRCCESRWVRSGMRAPPPMVATALTCAGWTPLRSSVSSSAARKPSSGSSRSCS